MTDKYLFAVILTLTLSQLASSRSTSSADDVISLTDVTRSDDTNIQITLSNLINTLKDVRLKTNQSFSKLCRQFCEIISKSSSCCEDIKTAALSHMQLSPAISSLDNAHALQIILPAILSVTLKHSTEMQQMLARAQSSRCEVFSANHRKCPLTCLTDSARDSKYCLIKQLNDMINSFKLILEQLIQTLDLPFPAHVAPTSGSVKEHVMKQEGKDLRVLAISSDVWTKIVNQLNQFTHQ